MGREVDRIIATCSDEVFELAAMGIPRGNVSIAPCGVDLGLFSADGEAEPRGRTHRIVTLGRLVPRKGIDLAVRALRLLKDQGIDDVELLVVGGAAGAAGLAADPEAQRLRGLARELGVEDQLVLRGQLSQRRSRRCCAAPTSSSAPRGTNRSGLSRWKRWPAVSRWSRPRSAA